MSLGPYTLFGITFYFEAFRSSLQGGWKFSCLSPRFLRLFAYPWKSR